MGKLVKIQQRTCVTPLLTEEHIDPFGAVIPFIGSTVDTL